MITNSGEKTESRQSTIGCDGMYFLVFGVTLHVFLVFKLCINETWRRYVHESCAGSSAFK